MTLAVSAEQEIKADNTADEENDGSQNHRSGLAGNAAVKISTGEPAASNYLRPELIGDLDHLPEDRAPFGCQRTGQIKSVVCFEISPEYRGKGIAARLLGQVCADAQSEGWEFVEAYPKEGTGNTLAFTGPLRLYEKAGFIEYDRNGRTIIMRKALK